MSVSESSSGDVASKQGNRLALGQLQPFGDDICASWRESESSVEMHEDALDALKSREAEGRIVLLSAPRAGHGKTHLLSRVAALLQPESVVAGLPWQLKEGLSWEECGRGVLLDLGDQKASPTMLQQVCAGVLATLLRRLIQTGKIPSADPAQALRVLQQDPMELFKQDGTAKVIGEWFNKHFEQLKKSLAESSGVHELALVEDWIQRMMDSMALPAPEGVHLLAEGMKNADALRAECFLRLASVWKPLVLVADHMDGLYRDPEAGMAVARMALALTTLPRVRVVLSVNQDLWDTTFGRQLPSALEDRLSARNVSLRGLNLEEGRALVLLRLREAGVTEGDSKSFIRFLELEHFFLGRASGSVAARGMLRHAARAWNEWVHASADALSSSAAPSVLAPQHTDISDAGPLPLLFDDAEEDLQLLARNLARDEGGKVVDLSDLPGISAPENNPVVPLPEADMPPESFLLDQPVGDSSAQQPASPPPLNLSTPAAPSRGEVFGGNIAKLREMLSRLKGGGATSTAANDPVKDNPGVASLRGKYHILRDSLIEQKVPMQAEPAVLAELLRLGGRRFPVVTYDEVEFPGLLGRAIPRWTLQGMELVFGLGELEDRDFWRMASAYVAGRLVEIKTEAEKHGEKPSQFKLLLFKTDADDAALENLISEEVIPSPILSHVDRVHLDEHGLAGLHAMRLLLKEVEGGMPGFDATAVSTVLASELDFFWKRITRASVVGLPQVGGL